MRHFSETAYLWYLVGLGVRRAMVVLHMSRERNPGLMTGASRARFVPFFVWVCSVVHLFVFFEDWMGCCVMLRGERMRGRAWFVYDGIAMG